MMLFAFDDLPRDITGLESIASSDRGGMTPGVFVLWVAALAVIGYLAYRWVASPRSRPSAEALALRSLARLRSIQLIAKGHSERHFTILSRIARRYFDRAYQTTSRRQSTAEFLESARQNPRLEQHLEFLTGFLQACDVARFAPPDAVPKLGRQLEADLETWLSVRDPSEIASSP